MADGAKDRFIEIALKRVGPEKFNRQNRRADEWTQDPAKLAAQKQIAGEPGNQDAAGGADAGFGVWPQGRMFLRELTGAS